VKIKGDEMKVTDVIVEVKPPTPAQAKVKSMQQSIDRQKLALAQERERQQNLKQADKMRKLQQKIVS
jgi:hypothetical protein